jgi:hypothetical protein
MTTGILLLTMTLTKDQPVLSSERVPHRDKTVTVKQNVISGHEPQMVSTPRLTD